MAQINFAKGEVQCKVVYYGPAQSGKTANLRTIHARSPAHVRGQLTSISTDGDRTLFFDFLPLNLGKVAGVQTKINLYAVPYIEGQNALRLLVLEGADGIVFVANSSRGAIDANREAMSNLRENLATVGREFDDVPLVFQWNMSDAEDALSPAEMEQALDSARWPSAAACAESGDGVLQTLKNVTGRVLEHISTMMGRADANAAKPVPKAAAEPAPHTPTEIRLPDDSDMPEPIVTPKWHRAQKVASPMTMPGAPATAPAAAEEEETHQPIAGIQHGARPIMPEEELRMENRVLDEQATPPPQAAAPAQADAVAPIVPAAQPEPGLVERPVGPEPMVETSKPAPEDLLEAPRKERRRATGWDDEPASTFPAIGGSMCTDHDDERLDRLVTVGGGGSRTGVRTVRKNNSSWDPEDSPQPLRQVGQPTRDRRRRPRTQWKAYPAPLAHVAAGAVFTLLWLVATGYLVHEIL